MPKIEQEIGTLFVLVDANGNKWTVGMVDYVPDEQETVCCIHKETGEAIVGTVAIHSISQMRVYGDRIVSFDDYWIAVGVDRYERAKVRKIEGFSQIVEKPRRKTRQRRADSPQVA